MFHRSKTLFVRDGGPLRKAKERHHGGAPPGLSLCACVRVLRSFFAGKNKIGFGEDQDKRQEGE